MPQTARQNTLREIFRTLKPGGSLFVLDYNLPEGILARLILKSSLKIVEGEAVYRMVLDGALIAEIGAASFILGERKLLLAGMLQIVKADKPLMGS
jgi:predicted methyltransferase